jgi:chromosome segregation ATPase
VTTRREVPLTGDTLAWVHSEISEIKSRLAIVAQAAEQSRGLSTSAADAAHQLRSALTQFDGIGPALMHVQDDLRSLRELLARSQDDINQLRHSRDEAERRALEESEVFRQDKNHYARRFSDIERAIELWLERQQQAEEHNRRTMDIASQFPVRLEPIESALGEIESGQSRVFTALSRIDQEIQRLSGQLVALQNEDLTQRERVTSNAEMLRRLETELEGLRAETNRIGRIDDRLELVQAERTRHNERLNEIAAELNTIDGRLNAHDERAALTEARMSGYQDDLRQLREKLQVEREQLGAYLNNMRDLQADFRKREASALEKEIKDLRARPFDVQPE